MTDTERERINVICEVAGVTEIDDLSDGFHTFRQLYYQRMILFAVIVGQNKDKAWKSFRHEDGELCFGGGWFIVGIDTPEGSYTYHYENDYYSLFDCEELERGKHWDGHTEKDVTRLLSLQVATDTNVSSTDTISRQAVITEFSCCDLTPDGGIDVNYAIDFLKQLPSTQPECEDAVPRTSVEYICRKNTVSTNPYEHKYHDKFIQFMKDPEISDFGRWQHSNGFNTALVAVKCDLDKVSSVTQKQPGEDIRAMCGECDAWNQYKNYPQPKWIPVTERPPEKEGRYVCTYTYNGKKDVFMFRFEDGDFLVPWYVDAITAWYKPLDPWEGEENGET